VASVRPRLADRPFHNLSFCEPNFSRNLVVVLMRWSAGSKPNGRGTGPTFRGAMPSARRSPYKIGHRMNENARPVIINWRRGMPEG
jgi:hypothetical protein